MLMMNTIIGNTTLLLLVVKRIVLDMVTLMNRFSTDMNVCVYLVIIEMSTEYVKKNVLLILMVTIICILVMMIQKNVVVMTDIPIMEVKLLVTIGDQILVLVLIL